MGLHTWVGEIPIRGPFPRVGTEMNANAASDEQPAEHVRPVMGIASNEEALSPKLGQFEPASSALSVDHLTKAERRFRLRFERSVAV